MYVAHVYDVYDMDDVCVCDVDEVDKKNVDDVCGVDEVNIDNVCGVHVDGVGDEVEVVDIDYAHALSITTNEAGTNGCRSNRIKPLTEIP